MLTGERVFSRRAVAFLAWSWPNADLRQGEPWLGMASVVKVGNYAVPRHLRFVLF